MLRFLRYSIWPAIKVRLRYSWWVLRYGGKKNIPRDVVFGTMVKNMERINKNLMIALRRLPEDLKEKEKKEFMDLLQEAGRLEEDIKEAGKQ